MSDDQGGGAEHALQIRVYYEDTDLAGIVYYANYLKFIERGRSELLRALGVDQARLKERLGLVFVVRRVEIDYLAPARFDDLLTVRTKVLFVGGARARLQQTVARADDEERRLASAQVEVVCVGPEGRAVRMPDETRDALRGS